MSSQHSTSSSASAELWLSARTTGTPWTGDKLATILLMGCAEAAAADSGNEGADGTESNSRVSISADSRHDSKVALSKLESAASAMRGEGADILTSQTKLRILAAALVAQRRGPDYFNGDETAQKIADETLGNLIFAAEVDSSDPWVQATAKVFFSDPATSEQIVADTEASLSSLLHVEGTPVASLSDIYSLHVTVPSHLASFLPSPSEPRPFEAVEQRLRAAGDARLPNCFRPGQAVDFQPNMTELRRLMGQGLRYQQEMSQNLLPSGSSQKPGSLPNRPLGRAPPSRPSLLQPRRPSRAEYQSKMAMIEAGLRRTAEQQASTKGSVQLLDLNDVAALKPHSRASSVKRPHSVMLESAPAPEVKLDKKDKKKKKDKKQKKHKKQRTNEDLPSAPVSSASADDSTRPKASRSSEQQERDTQAIEKLLGDTNRLNSTGRDIIERFLRGDTNEPSAAELQTAGVTRTNAEDGTPRVEIVLSVTEEYNPDTSTVTEFTMVFEMAYRSMTYRKLRRRKMKTQ